MVSTWECWFINKISTLIRTVILINVHVFYLVINCLHHRNMQFIIGGSMGGGGCYAGCCPPPIQFQKIENVMKHFRPKKILFIKHSIARPRNNWKKGRIYIWSHKKGGGVNPHACFQKNISFTKNKTST